MPWNGSMCGSGSGGLRCFYLKWDSKDDFMNHVQGPSFAKHIPGMGQYYVAGTDTFLEIKE